MPPCISTSCRAIDKPEPEAAVSRAWCRHRPGGTARRRAAGTPAAMPMPVSLTVTSTCEFTRSSAHLHLAAAVGELHGVRQQVPDDLLQPLGIAGDRRRRADRPRVSMPDALGVGRRRARVDARCAPRSRQIDRLDVRAASCRRRSARRRARPRRSASATSAFRSMVSTALGACRSGSDARRAACRA